MSLLPPITVSKRNAIQSCHLWTIYRDDRPVFGSVCLNPDLVPFKCVPKFLCWSCWWNCHFLSPNATLQPRGPFASAESVWLAFCILILAIIGSFFAAWKQVSGNDIQKTYELYRSLNYQSGYRHMRDVPRVHSIQYYNSI